MTSGAPLLHEGRPLQRACLATHYLSTFDVVLQGSTFPYREMTEARGQRSGGRGQRAEGRGEDYHAPHRKNGAYDIWERTINVL